MRHTFHMITIEIPIRELHSRTGHYVRKASANQRIVITERGKPVAELQPLSAGQLRTKGQKWGNRNLLPEFKALLHKPIKGTDSALIIAEDRDRDVAP